MGGSRDIEMMRDANRRLENRFGSLTTADDNRLKKYRARIRGASIHIRVAGIVQVISFLESKASPDSTDVLIIEDLRGWLTCSPVTIGILMNVTHKEGLLGLTTHQLAVLEDEAVEYLDRLARLLEGRYQALKYEDERRQHEREVLQEQGEPETATHPVVDEEAR